MRKIHLIPILFFISLTCFGQDNWNVTLLGQGMTNDIRYSGSWAYIAPDDSEYALIGARSGLAVFPIDDPANLEMVGWVPGPVTNWREITVLGQHAFVVTDVSDTGHSMQVVDLSFLPDSVHLVTEYTETFTKGHIIQRDLFSEAPYVYVNGTSTTEGVHILDVSLPENPVEVGVYAPGYYIHDCHVRGDYLFACAFNNSKVDIVDISNKTNPVIMGEIVYEGDNTHSCFTSKYGDYLFVCDEKDSLPARIFNISDLNNPEEVARYSANYASLVHNPYIKGDFAFVAHNTEGLRVVDIADPNLPVEVGFYDTWGGTSGGFNGLWSACPFFPSGKIIGANRHNGLFVWDFNETRAGRIYGRVYDADTGADLPGTEVKLSPTDTVLVADFSANFRFGTLSGTYQLKVEEAGYEPFVLDFELDEGDSLYFEIGLESLNTGLEEVNLPEIKVFPNPLTNSAIVKLKNLKGGKLQICTLNGTLIQSVEIKNQSEIKLNRTDLPKGVYLLSVWSEKGVQLVTEKLIVAEN